MAEGKERASARYLAAVKFITSAKEHMFSSLFVCLSVSNFVQKHEIFREGWQWANEQTIKFLWRSGSQPVYRDCFPDLSLLGDTDSV